MTTFAEKMDILPTRRAGAQATRYTEGNDRGGAQCAAWECRDI